MVRIPILLSLVLAGAVALAQPSAAATNAGHVGKRGEAAFLEADRNRDGRLSQAEWQEARAKRLADQFRRLDGNHDGSLTREELRQARQHRRQDMRARQELRRQRRREDRDEAR